MGNKNDKRTRRIVMKAAKKIQDDTLVKFRDDLKGMSFIERLGFVWMVLFVK